jgi:hypothetical protein
MLSVKLTVVNKEERLWNLDDGYVFKDRWEEEA